jgi:hypothetical protein
VGVAGSIDDRVLVAECAVPPVVVVVVLPVADDDAGLGQGPEDVDVEAFVAEPADST